MAAPVSAPAAAAPKRGKPSATRNAANGAVLQMAEAITLGMPLEVPCLPS